MYPLLKGFRIVDITTIILGPFATQILGDLGAEIIKIEALDGDMNRAIPPQGAPGIGGVYANNNRNKRSLAVDLKQDAGKDILRRLLQTSDALVHNMRQDALDRLGFGWETVHALNPRLVYCAALGYGSDGPYAGKPAYDDIIQAGGGIAGMTAKRDGTPAYNPTVTADKVAALHTVYAVLAALLHRERTGGEGQLVEMPMLEAIAAFSLNEHLMGAAFADGAKLGYHRTLSKNRKPYKTRDGHVAVLPYTTAQWGRAMQAIGREDIAAEPWFADNALRSQRSDQLYTILGDALAARTSKEWLVLFEGLDIPCGPVNSLEDLLEDPHLKAVGFFEPNYAAPTPVIRSLRQPVIYRGLAREADAVPPRLGADTAALLADLGFADADVAKLAAAGVIGGLQNG
ncbi:MAG: CaiB/BaiF CoA transferase family protein [Hyphomicrobiaceae bacterium]